MRMTRVVLVLTFVTATATITVASRPAGQRQPTKPVKIDSYTSYFRTPAETLAETILQVGAVVRGKIVGSKPHDTKDQIVTAFRFEVIEVLHTAGGRVVNPSEIDILRRIGERDRGPYIERRVQERFPPFDVGHEYVMYLSWNSALNGWVPGFGPDSAIDITSGQVDSHGQAKLTVRHKGIPAEDYLDLVRGFGRR
jgi:hypothetical protein